MEENSQAPGHGARDRDFLGAEQWDKVHSHGSGGFSGEGRIEIGSGGEDSRDDVVEVGDLITAKDFFHEFARGGPDEFRCVLLHCGGSANSPNCHWLLRKLL